MYSRLTGLYGKGQEKLKEIYDRQPAYGYVCHRVYQVTCPICGKTFYTQNSLARYCSYKCQYRANTIRQAARKRMSHDLTCKSCGIRFEPLRGDAKYCSGACRQRAYRAGVTDKHSNNNDAMINRNKEGAKT